MQKSHVLKWIKHEIEQAIPAVIFFMIAFNIIVLTNDLLLRPGDFRYATHIEATIFALVVGKVILIVNALPLINVFPNRPLIYNIFWKFLIYGIAIFLFRVIEHLVKLAYHHGSFAKSYQFFLQEMDSPVFWAVQIWLLALFLVYVIFSEFTRVIGSHKIKRLLLGREQTL